MLPVLFLSHGAPTLPFDPIEARNFFIQLGFDLPKPKAIVVFSAHWYERRPTVSASASPATLHDYFGFPKDLYEMNYPAAGDPQLAVKIATLLNDQDIPSLLDHQRGLDHGAWNPLLLMFPKADIPVLQISLITGASEATHFALGKALLSLRKEGILFIASGGAVHNLRAMDWQNGETPLWAKEFDLWLREKIEAGDHNALLNYKSQAPNASLAHPIDDHLMPIFCALGAAGEDKKGRCLHHSFAFASLSMATYRWG